MESPPAPFTGLSPDKGASSRLERVPESCLNRPLTMFASPYSVLQRMSGIAIRTEICSISVRILPLDGVAAVGIFPVGGGRMVSV